MLVSHQITKDWSEVIRRPVLMLSILQHPLMLIEKDWIQEGYSKKRIATYWGYSFLIFWKLLNAVRIKIQQITIVPRCRRQVRTSAHQLSKERPERYKIKSVKTEREGYTKTDLRSVVKANLIWTQYDWCPLIAIYVLRYDSDLGLWISASSGLTVLALYILLTVVLFLLTVTWSRLWKVVSKILNSCDLKYLTYCTCSQPLTKYITVP